MKPKKRAVLVGLGGRALMYRDAMAFEYPETVELVGLCDANEGRLRLAQRQLQVRGLAVPGCAPQGFEDLLRSQRADLVVVVSRDDTHDDYIVRALAGGCDVITEKPMTTTAEKCQRVIDAIKATGRTVRVTFNYRYAPFRTQVKELLQAGVIGRILSVEFKWLLDTAHGADYFRRWHRNKVNSGGLMVHKATHHFDGVNWFINSVPLRVAAMGARRFYTPEQAERYGLTRRAERCHGCPEADRCPFRMDLEGNEGYKALYLDNEQYDGYVRDRCVFGRDIDIEDSVGVNVEYRNGVRLAYSLVAYSPWEGYHIVFNGTKGRLEHVCRETSYVNGDGTTPGALLPEATTITVMPHFAPHGYNVPLRSAEGGHGGGDRLLLDDLFAATPPPDPAGRRADHRSGAYSILTGIAANLSMKEGRFVEVAGLVRGLDLPDFTDESRCDLPIPLPEPPQGYEVSELLPPAGPIETVGPPPAGFATTPRRMANRFMDVHGLIDNRAGLVYLRLAHQTDQGGASTLHFGADGPCKLWINGRVVGVYPDLTNPAKQDGFAIPVELNRGDNELIVAMDTHGGRAWGAFARFG